MPPNTPSITRPCPHCGAAHDVSALTIGDKAHCPPCGGWFLVLRRGPDGIALRPCDAPATWPRERRHP